MDSMETTKHDAAVPRVGLAVVFAALNEAEHAAVDLAWSAAGQLARHWQPAFIQYGIQPLKAEPEDVDLLVYLGESSRFDRVAGELASRVPVVLIKSTVEELMEYPAGSAMRYRMSTGVNGIASGLAQAAPLAPSVDWTTLPWPDPLKVHLHLDEAEERYVQKSLHAFQVAVKKRGISWVTGLPAGNIPFSVFLTMHDPAAATLAQAALQLWPQATVLAADGMVSTCAPDGTPWPERLIRVRHWSADAHSESNRVFTQCLHGSALPDFDSPGMTFGALFFLEQAFNAGADPSRLDLAGEHPGPLGPMRFNEHGKSVPERLIVFRGDQHSVLTIQ